MAVEWGGGGGGGGDLESFEFLLDMDKKSWLVRAVYRNFARGGGGGGQKAQPREKQTAAKNFSLKPHPYLNDFFLETSDPETLIL